MIVKRMDFARIKITKFFLLLLKFIKEFLESKNEIAKNRNS